MKKLLLFSIVMLLVSCAWAQQAIPSAKVGQQYGASFDVEKGIEVQQLEKVLGSNSDYKGQIRGEVIEVCTKKGCFVRLKAGKGKDPVLVRFVDYGFFMPQDIVGKHIVMDGTASIKETSVERLQHYAADAGKDAAEIAKITEPKRDIVIIASGVAVIK